MTTGPKPKTENRGGPRPGAGRKRETLSQLQVKAMLDKAKEYADKTGQTIDDILLTMIYGKTTTSKDRLAAIKLFKSYTMVHLDEGGLDSVPTGPGIALPAEGVDPTKVIPIGKGKKKKSG